MRLFPPSLKVAIHHTLPRESHIEGTLSFKGGLLVQGSIHGRLDPQGPKPTLTISEQGRVEVPSLEVDTLIVNGRMRALNLKARRVVLGATSDVKADIEAQIIEIHTGALFDGRVISSGEAPKPDKASAIMDGSASEARKRLESLVGAKKPQAAIEERSEA